MAEYNGLPEFQAAVQKRLGRRVDVRRLQELHFHDYGIYDDHDVSDACRELGGSVTRFQRAFEDASSEALEEGGFRVAAYQPFIKRIRTKLFNSTAAPFRTPDHAASWISSRPAPETGVGGLWLYWRDGEGDLRSRGVRGVSRLETLSRAATALATAIYGRQETPFSASDRAECVACILLGKPPLVAPVDYQIGRPGGPLVLRVNFPISEHALNEAYRRCCEKLGWKGKKRAAPKARKIQAFLANPARQGLSRGKVLAQWNEAFPDDEFDAPETLFRYAYRSPSKRPTQDSLNATLEEQREEFRQVRDGLPGERE